jgi:hypothetical protein
MSKVLNILAIQTEMLEAGIEKILLNPPEVCKCPHCKREFRGETEVEFIKDFGMCLGCDKALCDTREDFARGYYLDYMEA